MSKSIREIQKEFEQAVPEVRKLLSEEYASDERAGVQNLIAKYKKQEEKLQMATKESWKFNQQNYINAFHFSAEAKTW